MSRKAIAASLWLLSFVGFRVAVAADRGGDVSMVHVFVAGPEEALLRTRATVRELFARIHVDAVVERADDEAVLGVASPDTAPRAFLDFRSREAPRVVLVQRPSGRELERRTLPGSASLEVSVEEAAHVLYMAVESTLRARDDAAGSGGSAAPEPAGTTEGAAASTVPSSSDARASASAGSADASAAPRRPPATAAPPRDRAAAPARGADAVSGDHVARDGGPGVTGRASGVEAGVSAFALLSSFAAAHPLPGVGGALDGALGRGRVRSAALLSVGVLFPSPVPGPGAASSIHAETFRLDALVDFAASERVHLSAGLGGGVDRITFDAGPSTPSVVSTGSPVRIDPVLTALVTFQYRMSGAFGAFALASLDVDVQPHRYVTQAGNQDATVFALPRPRPAASLGLTYFFTEVPRAGVSATKAAAP